MKARKAQAWYIDYIVSFLIFVMAFMLYVNNMPVSDADDLDSLIVEAEALSDVLMSEGMPSSWDKDDVIIPGILTGGSLDTSKLANISSIGYDQVYMMMPITHDFSFRFEEGGAVITISGETSFGEPRPAEVDDLVVVERIVAYEGRLVKMVVELWDD